MKKKKKERKPKETYELVVKAEEAVTMNFYARCANAPGVCFESVLWISKNPDYYIERHVDTKEGYLFYVHVKEGRLVKVCVYRKRG